MGMMEQTRQSVVMSGDSSSMWTLGQRSGENSIKVVVKEYQGQVKVHIRHYFKAEEEDRWYPTKRGVALDLAEWDKFNESYIDIDTEVRRLRSKHEQVTAIPPRGVKRNLQSAFGSDSPTVC